MFDDDDEDGVNVMIDFMQKINFVRVLSNVVMPVQLTIKAEVLPLETAEELDFDIAFAKIKFWFETIVARSVAFCRSNTNALEMFTDEDGNSRVSNYLMITPHDPTDEHLGALFQAKMGALSGGKMEFGVVRVNSDSNSGLTWSYVGDWRQDLPQMQNWFARKPYYFDVPWWARGDASTIDMIGAGVTDFNQAPAWALNLDFIESAIRPRMTDEPATPELLDSVVIRGAFRPKVIEGDPEA